jgi:hypothetical protein
LPERLAPGGAEAEWVVVAGAVGCARALVDCAPAAFGGLATVAAVSHPVTASPAMARLSAAVRMFTRCLLFVRKTLATWALLV